MTSELEGILEAAAVSLPLTSSIRRNIRLQRYRNELLNPPNRAKIPVLPHLYQLISTGGQFLQYDSGIGDDGQIFIFTSDQVSELLLNSEPWFCDGTFVCPEIFYYVRAIHALVNGGVLPCLFALLAHKNQQTYQTFFREVSNLVPGIPKDIVFDFEQAAMNMMQLLLSNI